jgi:hypothetical protein
LYGTNGAFKKKAPGWRDFAPICRYAPDRHREKSPTRPLTNVDEESSGTGG